MLYDTDPVEKDLINFPTEEFLSDPVDQYTLH